MDCVYTRNRVPSSARKVPFDMMRAPPRPAPYRGPNPPYNYNYCLYGTVAQDPDDIYGFNLFDDYVVEPRLTNARFLRVYM